MTELVMLVGIGLKTSLVVIAAGLLSLALRRQAAAFSHVLWTAALVLCVLMPVALLLPSHEIVALPSAPTLPLHRAQGGRPTLARRRVLDRHFGRRRGRCAPR